MVRVRPLRLLGMGSSQRRAVPSTSLNGISPVIVSSSSGKDKAERKVMQRDGRKEPAQLFFFQKW